jgi:hypothetical protein
MSDPVATFQDRFRTTTALQPSVAPALALARRVVTSCTVAGKARFRTPADFDGAFRRESFRLAVNDAFGPPHPDARQLIYESADRMVIIKVKTKGYPNGMRPGGTMSIEITNGTGTAWKDVLCKLDTAGEPIPSNVITRDKLVETPEGLRVRRATGQVEEIMPHEVVLEAGAPPFDGDRFADRGHFDFLPGFDPRGAASLRPR